MAKYFNFDFQYVIPSLQQDLQTLEMEGAIYSYLFDDQTQGYVQARLELTPIELVECIEATKAYEEFLSIFEQSGDSERALALISSERHRVRVTEYNEWTRSIGQDETQYCYAAFLGDHLESLVTTITDRHEIVGRSYSGNRRFLLREILDMFPAAQKTLASRRKGKQSFVVLDEYDLRDLLFVTIKTVFPDARLEDPAPQHAGSSKRVDIVIPAIGTIIELKMVRDKTHASKVADELKIDIESYHSHPDCQHLVAFIWDPKKTLDDPHNLEKDLRGLRVKNQSRFQVEVVVKH